MIEVVREAKIFEAGSYPERGVVFAEADLDAVIAGFEASGGSVPVRVQHTDTAWDGKFGRVVKLWRAGRDLMAQISWPAAVWEFLCAMGTKKLSCGFDWRQRRLCEVSVVDKPRVAGAEAFLCADMMFVECDVESRAEGGIRRMAEEYSAEVSAAIRAAEERGRVTGAADERARVEAQFAPVVHENAGLKRKGAEDRASVILAGWKAEGKLPPACEKFAAAILVDGGGEVTFSDGGHMPVSEAFTQFVLHLPQLVDVVGRAIGRADGPAAEDEAVAARVYAGLGVTAEEVAAADAAEGAG